MTIINILSIIVQVILALSLLILVHELGHFMWARIFGVRVDKFYLFFDLGGKALFRWKPRNSHTEYGMGWLPLGGYCKIGGMVDESVDTEQLKRPVQRDDFRGRPAWQRMLIMSGGVINNFILAILLFSSIALYWGKPYLSSREVSMGMSFSPLGHELGFQDGDIVWSADGRELNVSDPQFIREIINAQKVEVLRKDSLLSITIPSNMMQRVLQSEQGLLSMQIPFIIDSVLPQSLAERAGLQKGDQILAINGEETPDISDVKLELALHKGDSLLLQVVSSDLASKSIALVNDSTGFIGVTLKGLQQIYPVKIIKYSIPESIQAGWNRSTHIFAGQAQDVKYVFTKEGVDQMGGLISIARLFPTQFSWYWFWEVCALLSVIFAFMNLLPIPALDGGHILFTLWEIITRKKASEEILIRLQLFGMVFLILLILYVNIKDIFRLF